jgi:SET domain-containing protein
MYFSNHTDRKINFDLNLYTYLAPSKVCDGVGVFSLVNIPEDTLIFSPGELVKILWSEVNENIHERIKTLAYFDNEGFWIDNDLSKLGQQYYINHSNSPNVAYNKDTGKLYAIRYIKKNEELTDYYFPGERDWLI